ncbi:hypothetical protein ACJRO7_033973 [Eucalyptus globulus]|uniref:Alginate lyase 2 domain-containing protein n=1 Tax=Eucalyptus globulus TaxID=34317 RepID=A0ABD3J553_EUCGL
MCGYDSTVSLTGQISFEFPRNKDHFGTPEPDRGCDKQKEILHRSIRNRYSGDNCAFIYASRFMIALVSARQQFLTLFNRGYDYSSGVWQFEGQGYVLGGTSGVCVMQVFGAVGQATTFVLRVYNGTLYYYGSQVLVENVYDKWFKLNVIHDADASNVKIYIDDQLRFSAPGHGSGASHYFKFGVYAMDDSSHRMESRWKDVKVLKKN